MKFLIFCLFLCVTKIYSANILCLMGAPSPSHHIWNRALAYGIAAKGHNLTILSPDFEKSAPKNVHYIHLEKTYSNIYSSDEIDLIKMSEENPIQSMASVYGFYSVACKAMMDSNGFTTLINYPNNFKVDLVVYDFIFGPCLIGFLHKFKHPPLVSISAFNNPPFSIELIGGHKQYAYIPHYSLDYGNKMNVIQRAINAFMYGYEIFYRSYYHYPEIDKLAKTVFGNDLPSVRELEQETKIMLVNSHPAVDYAQSLAPNVIEVGGLQISTPKPLPKKFADFIESSKKGAVIFSLGTNVRSDMLHENLQKIILEALGQLPEYNFIWKFESDMKFKIPKNVLIKTWLPQNDMLAHPKIIGFISHAGLLSTQEASWYGVPIIALPIFVDQIQNTGSLVRSGVAEKLIFKELTVKDLKNTIVKVLEEPSYTQNMKARARYMHDQPSKPLDRAVWWVEWLLRNPNPTFLRSPTFDLGLICSNFYDIICYLTLIPILFLCFIKKICCSAKSKGKNVVSNDKKKK